MTQGDGQPVTAEEWIAAGETALRTGDKSRAHQCFIRATELAPEQIEYWIWRAGSSDDPYEILACLHRVLLLDPGDTRARQGIAWVYLIYPQLKPRSPSVASSNVDTTPRQEESPLSPANAAPGLYSDLGNNVVLASLASNFRSPEDTGIDLLEAGRDSSQAGQPALSLSEQAQDAASTNAAEDAASSIPFESGNDKLKTVEQPDSVEPPQPEPNRITIDGETRRTIWPTLAGILYLPVAGFWLLMAYRQAMSFFTDGISDLGILAAWNAAVSILFLVIARALLERSVWGLNWGIGTALLGLAGAAFGAAPAQSQLFPVPFYVGIVILLGASRQEFETRAANGPSKPQNLIRRWTLPALSYSLLAVLLAVMLAAQRYQPAQMQAAQRNAPVPTVTGTPTTPLLSSSSGEIPSDAGPDAREAIRAVSTFYPSLAGGKPATHTIDRFIQVMLAGARAQGDTIVSYGWRATPRGESSWLVSYSFQRNDESIQLEFLVNEREARISGYNYAAVHFLDTTVDDLERTLAPGGR